MLWHIYLRKGQVFVPTVSKTDAGFFMDANPVAVHHADDIDGMVGAIEMAISRGNPVLPAPARGNFSAPVVLEHAKVKSWSTFEKSAMCWKVRRRESTYQLCPMRKNASGGWEDDSAKTETHATPQDVARRICELIQKAV
jgi:hypothetical protein